MVYYSILWIGSASAIENIQTMEQEGMIRFSILDIVGLNYRITIAHALYLAAVIADNVDNQNHRRFFGTKALSIGSSPPWYVIRNNRI